MPSLSITNANQVNLNLGLVDFAVEIWNYPRSPNVSSSIVGKRTTDALISEVGWVVYQDTMLDRYVLRISDGTTLVDIATASSSLLFNKFQHVLFVADRSGNGTVYVDGVLSGTVDISAVGDINNTTAFNIGACDALAFGAVDSAKVRVFRFNVDELSATTITTLVNESYSEFVVAKQIGAVSIPIRNFKYPEPTSVRETGLVAAYNMKKINSIVSDISGTGINGTVYGAVSVKGVSGDALQFDGVDDYVDIGNHGSSIKSIELLFKPSDITAHTDYLIDLNGTDYITVVNGTVTVNGFAAASTNIYVNGNASAILGVIDVFYHIIITSDLGFTASDLDIGRVEGSGYGLGVIDEVRLYTTELNSTKVTSKFNKYANQILFNESFSNEGADGVVKTPRGYLAGTGTFKISADITGHYLENTVPGTIQYPIKLPEMFSVAKLTGSMSEGLIYADGKLKLSFLTGETLYKLAIKRAETYSTVHGLIWDENTDVYTRIGNTNTPIQDLMKRCVLNDSGTVVYYLDASDSTKKANGEAANLDGSDGQVMVEIPKFYYSYQYINTKHVWKISLSSFPGGQVHPAFIKNGVEVDYRYIGAYEGIAYDASEVDYIDPSSPGTAATNWSGGAIDTVNDKLGSVSGKYPITNETRAEFRAISANRGTGWRQLDFYLASAVQLLYLVEYQTFYSQSAIGMGRTELSGGTWTNGSYIGMTGKSNSIGNGTFSVGGNTDDAYMTYRGIENFFGNVWKFVDGFNINERKPYLSNTDTQFADNTATNYTDLFTAFGITMGDTNGYVKTLEQTGYGFLPASVGGGAATYITDYYYQSTDWRVALLGGYAASGSLAGFFYWNLHDDSSLAHVGVAGRLCF